jgi:hypothetical protein
VLVTLKSPKGIGINFMINRKFELHFVCRACDWEWNAEYHIQSTTENCPECDRDTKSDRCTEIPLTNIDFIVDYMTWGSAMNQLFLIDAVTKHADMVIAQQDQLRIDMKNNFIHPEAWIACHKLA